MARRIAGKPDPPRTHQIGARLPVNLCSQEVGPSSPLNPLLEENWSKVNDSRNRGHSVGIHEEEHIVARRREVGVYWSGDR